MARGDTCIACGGPRDLTNIQMFCGMCRDCGTIHAAEGRTACNKVNQAVAKGLLARARTHLCVDCGAQATEWEHRDYTKPLDVAPVCRPCNHKRPPAFNSVYRPPLIGGAAGNEGDEKFHSPTVPPVPAAAYPQTWVGARVSPLNVGTQP